MNVPRTVAVLVCLFLALSIVQGYCWHWRPEPGWHPSWWQFHTWASFGALLGMLAMLPVVFIQELGMTNPGALGWVAMAVGFAVEFGFAFVASYWITKKILTYVSN